MCVLDAALRPSCSLILAGLWLTSCVPLSETVRPKTAPAYGEFKDPFPAETVAPAAPAIPAPAAPAAAAAKRCGELCGTCSRAAELCDAVVRVSGSMENQECRLKESHCGALVRRKRATGCTCD